MRSALLVPLLTLCLAGIATLGSPGCMFFSTKAETSKLRAEVRALSHRLSGMKKNERDTLAALKKARGELMALKGVLPQARAILLRNSARFGARLDRLASTVAKLKGRLESLETDLATTTKAGKGAAARLAKLAEMVARVKVEVTRLVVQARQRTRPAPKTAGELFAAANVARLTGRGALARRLYGELIRRFPRHRSAEAAHYLSARTYFDVYDYRGTVVAVARQLKAFPRGPFAARGRLLSARSYFELKRCRTAARILARLVRLFPHAAVAGDARKLLLRVRRLRTVSRYCRR